MPGQTPRDPNYVPAASGVSSTDPTVVLPFKINPVTGRLLAEVSLAPGLGNVSQSSNSGSAGRMKVSAGADKSIQDYAGGAGLVMSDALGVVSAAIAGTHYLAPNGNGSALTGITASQVGALTPTGDGSGLTGITAAQTGSVPASYLDVDPALAANSDSKVATQKATKSYVDTVVAAAIKLQGDWNASTNSPDITGTTTTGYAWRVSVAGTTNLGGIASWDVGDLAVKTGTGWMKVANQDVAAVWGNIGGTLSSQTDLQAALNAKVA